MGAQFTVQINDVTLESGRDIGGRYTLTDHLGQGGFAQVFKAHDSRIERDVAIKFLNLHSRNTAEMGETIIERFEREAKLAAQISHPGVVNIFDYGVLGDAETVPYIVMELLRGWDLDEELHTHGPMEAQRALPLFVTCLEALGRAHRKGIVHKDLKPANLFLSNPEERDEALRIVDFGIAHMRSAVENRLTSTGQILGTPQYLAPEYIERQDVSPALDIYQMGLVLLETLSGEPGVAREHQLLTLQAHSSGEIDVPITLMESPLAPVLKKAMALDPSERYADGLEFADALAEVDPGLVPVVPRGAPKQRLAGAADVSGERAVALTVPVGRGAGGTDDERDHTTTVLYMLVAGLVGAVLLAGVAAASLLGQDDGGSGESEAATAVSGEESDGEELDSAADEEADKQTGKETAKEAGAQNDDDQGERAEDDRERSARKEPRHRDEKRADEPEPKHDHPGKGKSKGKKTKKAKKRDELPRDLRESLEKVRKDGEKVKDTVRGVEDLFGR